MKEAPSIKIINELIEGVRINAYAPKAIENAKSVSFGSKIFYAENKYDVLNNVDALVLITEG